MKELVEIEESIVDLKFKFKDWIFVLDKLKREWSAVRRELVEQK
jgi:hypothetical protein